VAISRRLLNDDESVLVSTRTHVKALLFPLLLLIVIAAVAGYLTSLPSGEERDVLALVIWLVALVAIVLVVLKPFLTWLTTTYTVTSRRLITRSGVLTRRGHDIPLIRISDVAYEHGILDRVLGCGTLVISDASEHGRVKLHDIPHVEQVHLRISKQLFGNSDTNTHSDTHRDIHRDPHRDPHRADDGS